MKKYFCIAIIICLGCAAMISIMAWYLQPAPDEAVIEPMVVTNAPMANIPISTSERQTEVQPEYWFTYSPAVTVETTTDPHTLKLTSSNEPNTTLTLTVYPVATTELTDWLSTGWPRYALSSDGTIDWSVTAPYSTPLDQGLDADFAWTGMGKDQANWLKYFQDRTQDIREQAKLETINNLAAVRLPLITAEYGVAQTYVVFIRLSDEHLLKATCTTTQTEPGTMCSDILATIQIFYG